MGFVGLARDEETFEPRAYLESLPGDLGRPAGAGARPDAGHRWFAGALLPAARRPRAAPTSSCCCVLAAPEGIERLARSGLPLRLVTASIDEGLNDKMFIVPGLGDAGDRQFGGMPRF